MLFFLSLFLAILASRQEKGTRHFSAWLWFISGLLLGGGAATAEPAALRLATTTSVENSGLLVHLLPAFEKASGIKVHVIAVGTGKALKLGEDGEVDVLLVHSPPAEKEFLAKGFGVDRREIMFNDFLFVGPAGDPANLKGCASAAEVMERLSAGRHFFISRGDRSGTHQRERSLWDAAEKQPKGEWYLEVGQGMGPTLMIASEKQGYTFTDRGTFLAMRSRLELRVAYEGGANLLNVYSVIGVNPARHPKVRPEDAQKFIQWVVSEEGQKRIAGFTVDGQPLFHPLSSLVK